MPDSKDAPAMINAAEQVDVATARLLEGVPHGFLGRSGGVSEGDCAGLNVGYGSGDDPDLIAENRRRAVDAVAPGAQLVTCYQIHSADAVLVEAPWGEADRPHADALVTTRPGLLLGILTADCTPVLFVDRQAGVVGAAHAGWKGAFGGVLESTVALMESVGADRARIQAAVGPTIGRKSYEVDDGFYDRFVAASEDNDLFFTDGKPGHHQFDLEGYVLHRLAAAGVQRIEALGLDTYALPDRYYSYRRATHRNEASYGRQISLIALPG